MEQKLKKEKELELKKKEKVEKEEKEKAEKEAATAAAKKEEETENKTPQKEDKVASSKSKEKKSNKQPVLLDNKPKVNSLTRFLVSNPVVKTKDKTSKDTSNSGSSKAKAVEEITQFDELLSGGLSRDQIDRYNRERYRTGENPYKRKRPKKPLRKRKKLMVKI